MAVTKAALQLGALASMATLATTPALALTSQVQIDFFEPGVATAYSSIYSPGDNIQFTENYGGYTLLVNSVADNGASTPISGDAYLSMTIQVTGVPASQAPVLIGLSITGVNGQPGDLINFDSQFTGIFHTESSANYHSYYDPTNVLFGQADPLSTFNGVSMQANSYDQDLLDTVETPYSMSLYITFIPFSNAHPTLDAQLAASNVPEPMSLALMGFAISGLGVTRLRYREGVPQ
jgi:hypothetical protein